MKWYGDLDEVKRLESMPEEYVLGNQAELDAQDIKTAQPESHPVPELPSYTDADGREHEARLIDAGKPRQSEHSEDVKSRSLLISGVNGPSQNWLLITYLSKGAIDAGAVECCGCQRRREGMLAGPPSEHRIGR